jgi:hypothetical protein
MKNQKSRTFFTQMLVILACAQFIACGKSSDSSGSGSGSPVTATAPGPEDTETPEKFEPAPGGDIDSQLDGKSGQIPPAHPKQGQKQGQQQEQQQGKPDHQDQHGGNQGQPEASFEIDPNAPNMLPPGRIPPGLNQPEVDGGGQGQNHQTPQQVFTGKHLTGFPYNQNYSYSGSGSDQLLADLKNRYSSMSASEFSKSRDRAANIAKIRIGFNSVSNQVYAMVVVNNGRDKVLEFRGSPNLGMQALQNGGPRLSLNCVDQACTAMVGRLDYNDGSSASFVYRNLDKRLVFDFITSPSLTEQTYRNWTRLIDSQLGFEPNAAKVAHREYASYEVAFGRSEAVLVIQTNCQEVIEISVPMVVAAKGNSSKIRAPGLLRGLSGTAYLSNNILKTEIVEFNGNGNLVIQVTTGRSAVDRGEFLISVIEK